MSVYFIEWDLSASLHDLDQILLHWSHLYDQNAHILYTHTGSAEALVTYHLGMLHRVEVKSASLFLNWEPDCWNEI